MESGLTVRDVMVGDIIVGDRRLNIVIRFVKRGIRENEGD